MKRSFSAKTLPEFIEKFSHMMDDVNEKNRDDMIAALRKEGWSEADIDRSCASWDSYYEKTRAESLQQVIETHDQALEEFARTPPRPN